MIDLFHLPSSLGRPCVLLFACLFGSFPLKIIAELIMGDFFGRGGGGDLIQ